MLLIHETITSSSDNLMGIFGSEFDASAQPIVKSAWPTSELSLGLQMIALMKNF